MPTRPRPPKSAAHRTSSDALPKRRHHVAREDDAVTRRGQPVLRVPSGRDPPQRPRSCAGSIATNSEHARSHSTGAVLLVHTVASDARNRCDPRARAGPLPSSNRFFPARAAHVRPDHLPRVPGTDPVSRGPTRNPARQLNIMVCLSAPRSTHHQLGRALRLAVVSTGC